MLYVFHVDTGRMIKFDMNVALGSVQNLKEIIQRAHGLPSENIVLLVSGGDMLSSGKLVCSYSAGTDTNPIFMFSTVDVKSQPGPNIESSNSDSELSNQVMRSLSLPANYTTVVIRAQLAQQIYELAREEETICERLVHEQHLQQQGWSAVIANMEDLTDEFRQRFENFSNCFEEHLSNRDQYLELMKTFNDDLVSLSMIPILPGLLQHAHHEFHGFDDFLDNDDVFSRSQQNESMIIQLATDTTTNIDNDNKIGGNERGIVSSSSGSGGVEQKRPRLSKENTPDSMLVGSGGGGSAGSGKSSVGSNKGGKSGRSLTLLQWITAKENHYALKTMAEECSQGLETFTAEKYEKLKNEVYSIISVAQQEDIKEIKGLENRLCGLEKMIFDLKKFVQDQKEHSTAFQQNQSRASNLGDASILPDLCASHQGQLSHMLNHHLKIRDYRRRVSKAKDELGSNLNKRLKYIVHIENTMSNLDNNLLFFHRCLRRLQRHINIIQQIHQTPRIYVAAVTEVVRRRLFSTEFVQWASTLACDFDSIHSEEVQRRREFNTNFEGHFLNTLFPGMNDMPPAFANEHPIVFDASLPNITKNDFDMLSTFLPEITENIQIPDMGTVIEFFISRSGNKNSNEKMITSTTQKSQSNTGSAVEGIISLRPIDLHAHLKDGFESETDTEEFEKVDQSTNEKNQDNPQKEKLQLPLLTASVSTSTSENKQPETVSASIETESIQTNTVETLTEENLGSRQLEIERLKLLLKNMSQVSYQCLELLKNNLESIKSDHQINQIDIQSKLNTLSETWSRVHNEYDSRERFSIEQIKILHLNEIDDLKLNIKEKDNELELIKCKMNTTESSHNDNINLLQLKCDDFNNIIENMNREISILEDKLKNNEIIKEQAIHEIREKLNHEHKTEIESLRCRFKLMTSMERSPSDTSLEKIEKSDMIEISCHESILLQTREDFINEKKEAIREALELEKSKWELNMAAQSLSPASVKAMADNMELLKKMIEEKDKQLDAMRERDLILSKENCQLKMKIEALTNEDESDKSWLKEKIEFLNRDKNRLEQELGTEKIRRLEMETSVAAIKTSTIESTRSKQGRPTISTDSCNAGEIVFVVWNIRHKQFIIVQETPCLYFVHGDSLNQLNLKLPIPGDSEIPVPFYTLARVLNKEYCQARKEENRYKVAKGTKFYRIKLDPLTEFKWHNRRERLESTTSSSSGISVNRSTATVQQLIDSCAQTENQASNIMYMQLNKDSVDSPSSSSSSLMQLGNFKERTLSVTSITEEEDEPIALISDRNRYVSVSEEDERAVTDQPSSLSTDYENSITATISTSTTNILPAGDCRNDYSSENITEFGSNTISQELLLNNTNDMDINTSLLLDSSSNQNDDSDEYRSLETKDDHEFPITTGITTTTSTTSSTIQTISPTPSTDN